MTKKSKKTVYVIFEDFYQYNVQNVYWTKNELLAELNMLKNGVEEYLQENACVKLVQSNDTVLDKYYRISIACPTYSFHVGKCNIEAPDDMDISHIQKVWVLSSYKIPYTAKVYACKEDAEAMASTFGNSSEDYSLNCMEIEK